MNRLAFLLLLVLFCWSTSGAQQESDGLMSDDAPSEHQFAIRIPELEQTHYQSLDAEQGRYSFGYAFPDQMREESRSADGQVSGSYSYRDPNGNANQVQYRADKSGFRVTASNQPIQDTAEVAEARQKHLKIWEAIANHNRALQQRQQQQRVNVQPAEAEPRTPNKEFTSFIDLDEEKELVAPPEPVPQVVQPSDDKVMESSPEVVPSEAIAEALNVQDTNKPLLINFDDIVDDEKEAVITAVEPISSDPSVIEIDSEPVKLLAQLYAKHLENNKNPPSIIPRPEGFYPQISEPASGYDIFSRYDSSDKESIETINPEYIDLRAFLLTNRFKEAAGDEQMKPAESSKLEGDELDILKDVMASPLFNNEPSDYDLLTSDEDDPDRYNNNNAYATATGSYHPSSQLYNQYYNLDSNKPVYITRESWNELPESLKLSILGLGSVDGEHTAQVSPAQHHNKNHYSSLNTKQAAAMPNIYSPYSSYYSPYYYYNHMKNYGAPAAVAGYNSRPSYYPSPSKNYYGGYYKNPESYYHQSPYPYYYDNPYYYY